jgi:hypothetical protein
MPKTGRSSREKSAEKAEFSEQEIVIARLLAGFDSDRSHWSDDTVSEVANVRAMALFFCPVVVLLKRRGKTLERACYKDESLAHLHVNRRPFNTLAAGNTVTLDTVLQVNTILNSIAESANRKTKAVTTVRRHSRESCLVLEEDDVIPSHIWVDGAVIREFRDRCGLTRKGLAELMFGKGLYEQLLQKLEEGERVQKKKKKKEEGKGEDQKLIAYDYRVTPFTRDRIGITIGELTKELAGRFEDSNYVGPAEGALFSTSHRAGLGAYNRTRALPMNNGNSTRPLGNEEKQAISGRVKDFAKAAPKKITARVRSNDV